MNSITRRFVIAALCCAMSFAVTVIQAASVNVSGALVGTNNWYRTNIYTLNAMVFVRSNAVLNIEAGTVIKGHNTASFSTNIGSLIICRGAKIFAEGTPQNPIIFTADVDDTTFPDDLDIYQRGLWGGLVILGRTTINGALDVAGNAATPKYEVYEGLPDVDIGGEKVLRFGGTDDDDNSGVLRYVSLRHGGALLATDKEINGLSLGAVGRGTKIEFVEAYAFSDDGFEFFGGTVNTKYLVSAFCDDDAFDTDMGYRGTNQFWFAIQPPDKRNYGMELNNQINEIATATLLTPQADFKVYNMTVIGSGTGNTNVNGGRNAAVILRPYAAPKIFNSIFTDFNERGIELETRNGVFSDTSVTNNYAQFFNNLWWGFVTGSGSQIVNNTATNLGRFTAATNYWTDTTRSNLIVDPQLVSISRTNVGATLDPRPSVGSPALNPANVRATPNDGFLTAVDYVGAFGPKDLWIANWTALAEYGVVTPAAQQVVNISGALVGTNNWYRTNIYQLNAMVFVRSNAVLNIEAGTVIKGHNTASFSTNIGSLIICRGAKIFAEGTPQNPIIFTADVDDTTFPDDLDIYQRGLWGGLVILGRTVINGALDVAGNAATPKYEVYEGLPDVDIGGEKVLRFGGTDDDDNSGVLRYVSLRHGGALLATDKEINGLSLGAVGRGTKIEFVEAYAFSDDGFEFFGGTVNTKYLVSAFNDDDSFDTDMGYRGTNQFWFAVQPPDKRNYGMELNNQINEIATATLLTPQADFKVYNMTIIGSGAASTNVNGGRNAAVILRPYAAPKIFNSIFTDFNERGIELETRNGVFSDTSVTNNYAQFFNNLWWGFVTGSGSQNVNNTATNLGRFTAATNYWTDTTRSNLIVDPQLTSISRTNDSAPLDPRPRVGSPALNPANIRATPGDLTAANYIGAFGSVNWASDWTALNEYFVLSGVGGGTPTGTPTLPVKPTIVSQPIGLTKHLGASATFTVLATGDAPLAYQWYFNNSPIGGAVSSGYTIGSVGGGDAGNYFAIVTNNAGAATSSVVSLTVVSDPQTEIIDGSLTGTNNWYRTNIYLLNAMVFVRSNAVLNIEAGTVIKGHNVASFSTNIGSLIICRGAKIFAEGTPQNPIIFTADIDDTTFPDDLDIYQRGLWGGLVILGRTVINGALDIAGNAATPKYEVYEGLPDVDIGGEKVLRFGGTDDDDNSGVLRYVSLRHGGALLATDKEINGLSLGAVGRGTKIEFVEAYAFSDDGFEFFGGTVNTKYLVSAFCDDDAFDTDMGYRGTNQFWFAIQPPDKRNYGMELNNQINEIATPALLTPQADFKVYNATIIGSGTNNTVVNGGRNAGVILRPYAAPKIFNSIFTDFNERGIELETRNGVFSDVSVTNGYAQFENNLWWGFVTGSGSQNVNNTATNLGRFTQATNYWTDTSRSNLLVDPQLLSISRTNVGATLDPRPKTGSPALNLANVRATPNDGFLTPVDYVGAFGPKDLWIANWTALAEYGVVTPAAQQVVNISGALTGTHNWYRTNIYQLNAMVFVRSNAVLNIEAGTIIKGHNTASFSTNIGSLIICRGAKIFAEGTPQNPIIFTADVDDTTFPDDLDIYQRGLWGGLVILGRTVINGALDVGGNAATPKYEVYEGLPDVDIGGEKVLRFGGTDDDDNSGVLRYVSLRHGGALLATDKEINGLSLGAVGRGTKIEFVEAYAFSDDGFEFFGGTVNTKYLVSAFNDDDSFDTDMGYRGTNQFWFAIQPPDKRNYGMELNNQINEIATATLLTPQADFKVYNMTIIGSGAASTNVNGGRNAAVILRPYAAPKIYNSIFTDFNERGIELETRNGVFSDTSVTNNYAQFFNNLWWGFVTGSGSQNVNNTATNLGRFTAATNYWTDTTRSNLIVDPQLTGISRTNVGTKLDPRPKAGSPALNPANVHSTPGGLSAASYVGAFGSVNWASDWTALGEYCVLSSIGAGTPLSNPAPITPPTPGQPTLTVARGVGLITISFVSEVGVQYQLQSATDLNGLPAGWANDGAPQAGTGGVVSFTPTIGPGNKFFRVVVP